MWEGRPYEVFTARIGDHNARSLDLKSAMVVGVSAAGDVAVLTHVRRTTNFIGTVKRLIGEVESEQGLAWSPDGREIWYAATGANARGRVVWAITPEGTPRQIFQVPGDETVCDMAEDGRLLFSHETIGAAQLVASPPGAKEFVFLGHEGDTPPRAYRVSLHGGPARRATNQQGAEFWNKVSPDGRFLLQAPGVASDYQGHGVIVDLASGRSCARSKAPAAA